MIRMIKGTYGLVVDGGVEAMTKHSGPFSLSEAREAELVAAGVAEKVEESARVRSYADMKMHELRKVAAELGVDVSGTRSKKEVVAILTRAEAVSSEDEAQYNGLPAEE